MSGSIEDIEKIVKKTIREVTKIPDAHNIYINSRLADIGVDSFTSIELVFALEDAFNISISDEEVAQIKTVNDIVNRIMAKTKQ